MDASPPFRRSRLLCEQSESADSIQRAGSRRANDLTGIGVRGRTCGDYYELRFELATSNVDAGVEMAESLMDLFTKPTYKDWAFWIWIVWTVVGVIATFNYIHGTKHPSTIAYVLDAVAFVFFSSFGLIPARTRNRRRGG